MSTLRITNIEAKGDPSSPSIDEKVKIKDSTGNVILEVDGKAGAGETVFVSAGIVTATQVNVGTGVTITDGTLQVGTGISISDGTLQVGTGITISAGVVTATAYDGDSATFTILNAGANTALHVDGGAPALSLHVQNDGIVAAGTTISAGSSITVGDSFIQNRAVGLGTTTTTGRNSGVGTAVGQMIYNAQTGNVQVYKAINGWVDITHVGDDPPEGHTATGGTISNYVDGDTRYRLHEFTSSGTFVVSTVGNIESTVDFLVVAGGGGGGSDSGSGTGGGGGAGGYRTSAPEGPGGPSASAESGFPVSAVTYTVTVGAGGGVSSNGSNSYFGPPSAPEGITSQGGGDGGNVPGGAGGNGGSGGGGGGPGGALGSGNRVNGSSTPAPNQGHDGAPGSPPAGGGGGAASAGGVTGGVNGNGGIGKRTNISGPAFSIGFSAPPVDTPGNGYFAGGGSNSTTAMGGGGAAGGSPGASGTTNSGGGGGGGRGNTPGGSGGSGAVYIRYQVNPSQ